MRNEQWAARPAKPPSSIFGNYAERVSAGALPLGIPQEAQKLPEPDHAQSTEPLQTAIDTAIARSFIYRFLAQAYEDPTEEGWAELTKANCLHSVESAVRALAGTAPALAEAVAQLCAQLKAEL